MLDSAPGSFFIVDTVRVIMKATQNWVSSAYWWHGIPILLRIGAPILNGYETVEQAGPKNTALRDSNIQWIRI